MYSQKTTKPHQGLSDTNNKLLIERALSGVLYEIVLVPIVSDSLLSEALFQSKSPYRSFVACEGLGTRTEGQGWISF